MREGELRLSHHVLSRRSMLITASAAGMCAFLGLTPWRASAEPSRESAGAPLRIAIAFAAGTSEDDGIAREIAQTVTANLERSGGFTFVDASTLSVNANGFDRLPQFDDLRAINAQAFVVGRVGRERDNTHKVEFRLWDVSGRSHLLGQQYAGAATGRAFGNEISSRVVEKLTGQKAQFD